MYHYKDCGLNNVYLHNGFSIDKDGNLHIENMTQLHKVIGRTLVEKPARLKGKEIKFIRHMMDLSQKMFAELIGVSYQSVLSWEKSKRVIPKTADHLLRALFLGFLNTEDSRFIFDTINQISDLDAERTKAEKESVLNFSQRNGDWKSKAA